MFTYSMPNLIYMHTYIHVFIRTLSYSRSKALSQRASLNEVLKALIRSRLSLFLLMVLSPSATGGIGQFPVMAFSLLVLYMLTYLCVTDYQRVLFFTTLKAQIKFLIFHNTDTFLE